MVRNLKALSIAAMALTAFGALAATSARAAEEKFHCSVEPCTLTLQKDGTGTTAHHVFALKGETPAGSKASIAFTCDQLTGEATVNTKTATEITFKNLRYDGCKAFGQELLTDFNSCGYKFTSTGGGMAAGSQMHLECSVPGDGIDFTVNGVACLKVTPFTATGIKYHDAGTKKEILTAELKSFVLPKGSTDIVNTSPSCTSVYLFKTIEEFIFLTGNMNIIAETHAGSSASVWFE